MATRATRLLLAASFCVGEQATPFAPQDFPTFACLQKSGCGHAGAAAATGAGNFAGNAFKGGFAIPHDRVRSAAEHATSDFSRASRGSKARSALENPSEEWSAFNMFSSIGGAAAQDAVHSVSETANVIGSGLLVGAKVAASHASVTANRVGGGLSIGAQIVASTAADTAEKLGGCLSVGAQVAASAAADTAEKIGEGLTTACIVAKAATDSVTETVMGACKETATVAPQVMHVAVGAAEQLSVRAMRLAPHVATAAVGVAGEVAKGAAKVLPHATKAAVMVAREGARTATIVQESAAEHFNRTIAAFSTKGTPKLPRRLPPPERNEEQELDRESVLTIDVDELSCNGSVSTVMSDHQPGGGFESEEGMREKEEAAFKQNEDKQDMWKNEEMSFVQNEDKEDKQKNEEMAFVHDDLGVPAAFSSEVVDEVEDGSMFEVVNLDEPLANVSAVLSSDASAVEPSSRQEASRLAAEAVARVFQNAHCSRYEGCSHLEGLCCPTPEGILLGCCALQGLVQEQASG